MRGLQVGVQTPALPDSSHAGQSVVPQHASTMVKSGGSQVLPLLPKVPG